MPHIAPPAPTLRFRDRIAPTASTAPTLRFRRMPAIAPTASTAATLRSRRMPPIAPIAPTLRFRHLPPIAPTASTLPTLRFRHLMATTFTGPAHRTHTASTTFVANTLARIGIPTCAVSWREIPHRETRFGIASEKNVALCASWPVPPPRRFAGISISRCVPIHVTPLGDCEQPEKPLELWLEIYP